MGFCLFAIVLALVGELLWRFKFQRDGKKQFGKYDKEHSNVAVLNAEEVVSKLNKTSSLGISDIKSESNQVNFICEKDSYTINIENGTAYVEYDMPGYEFRISRIGRIVSGYKNRFHFWKAVHKAMLINTVMDTFQNDSLPAEPKEYEKIKIYAKASVVAGALAVIFAVIGVFGFAGSLHDNAISEAQTIEFFDGVTYGELIDVYLRDADWTAFNGENDIAVVEVNGRSVEGEKICIQFCGEAGMGFSYRSLKLKYFEADGVSLDSDAAMEYIYWYYYLM